MYTPPLLLLLLVRGCCVRAQLILTMQVNAHSSGVLSAIRTWSKNQTHIFNSNASILTHLHILLGIIICIYIYMYICLYNKCVYIYINVDCINTYTHMYHLYFYFTHTLRLALWFGHKQNIRTRDKMSPITALLLPLVNFDMQAALTLVAKVCSLGSLKKI